jgi:CRISPR/Cas system-associated protein Cas5 (RAMP superfamily)
MWNVKTKVIPVIIRATGAISKSFRKYLSNIPGKHDIKELQKTDKLSTVHVNQKVLIKSTDCLNWERALNVQYSLTTEYLQHYVPWKRGLFQVYNSKC